MEQVSASYGVARSWIYELLARYRAEGDAAFEPRSRRPHHQPTAIPAGTAELIIRLRRQLARQGLDAGAHTIAWHLAQQHQLTVSEATIWRTLQRAGLITPEPKKKPKTAYICFAAEQPNQMWQTDFTHYRLTRPDGTPGADVEILTFLDDHSRYALSVTCHQPVTGPAVVAAFRQTVADQGIPASVLSDNGMVFTTRFAGGHSRPRHHQRLPSRTPPSRRDAEALQAEPPHHLRQSGTLPTNVEEMARCPAAATPDRGRAASPLRPIRRLLQQLPAAPLPGRRTPAAAYQARPKATPRHLPSTQPQARVRRDIIDTGGKLTLRHNGRLHHIGVGRTHARTPILMLINGLHIRIIHATTGEFIRELTLNPAVDYQARGVRKPRPKPS